MYFQLSNKMIMMTVIDMNCVFTTLFICHSWQHNFFFNKWNFIVQLYKISLPNPWKVIGKSMSVGWGSLKAKCFKRKVHSTCTLYEAWGSWGGGRDSNQTTLRQDWGRWIFFGTIIILLCYVIEGTCSLMHLYNAHCIRPICPRYL